MAGYFPANSSRLLISCISKCGDAMMREMLFEAALVLMTHSRKWSWLKAWGMKIARHRGMKRAIVAVARRLAVIMHRMAPSFAGAGKKLRRHDREWILGVAFLGTLTRSARPARGFTLVRSCSLPTGFFPTRPR